MSNQQHHNNTDCFILLISTALNHFNKEIIIKYFKYMFDYVSQSIKNKGTSLKHDKRYENIMI